MKNILRGDVVYRALGALHVLFENNNKQVTGILMAFYCSRERSRLGGKHGKSRSPSPARSACSASVSASSSSGSSDTEERVSAILLPPPDDLA